MDRPDQARVTAARADIAAIIGALKLYRLDNGTYPTTEQTLGALVKKPDRGEIPRNWKAGGYLDKLPVDPWAPIISISIRAFAARSTVLARQRPQARRRGARRRHRVVGVMRMRATHGARGFTLIELLVVVAIIVVIVGLAGAQLTRGPADIVREESEHLALLLRPRARRRSCRDGCSPSAPGASPTASCVLSATAASR